MKSILTLFLVCIISSGILASVYYFTKPQIESISDKNSKDMAKKIFSASMKENADNLEVKTVTHDEYTMYEVYSGNDLVGVDVFSYSDQGYGGRIDLLVGIKDCLVVDFEILKDSETPGLGSRAKEDDFRSQFSGKGVSSFNWKVKKDGGDVDSISSATITSRAVTSGVKDALLIYSKYYGGCVNE